MLFWLTLARFRRNFVRKQIDSTTGAVSLQSDRNGRGFKNFARNSNIRAPLPDILCPPLLTKVVVLLFGVPEALLSNCGTNFLSHLMHVCYPRHPEAEYYSLSCLQRNG
jgi:hypothetical protein